jgi:hypothetical protein
MVGISSWLRLVTLVIVAIGMSHAAVIEAEADSATAVAEKAELPNTSVPRVYVSFVVERTHGKLYVSGDAIGYSSEAGSAPAAAEKVESPSVTQGYVFH